MSRKVVYIAVAIALVALVLIAAKKHGTVGYFAFPNGNWVTVKINAEFTKIQNLSLPPGSYIANASAVLSSQDPSYVFVDCIFMLNSSIRGEPARAIMGGTYNNFTSLPLTIGFTIEEPTELAVACVTDGTQVWSQASPITAIRVENLVIQEGFQPSE